jgi:hypothetical protein
VAGGWINCILRSFITRTLYQRYYYDNLIKKYEMGVAHSIYREIKNGYKILVGKPEGRRGDHLEDLGIVGR